MQGPRFFADPGALHHDAHHTMLHSTGQQEKQRPGLFSLSFKHGAYVQEPLTHDQAVPHAEKHAVLFCLRIIIQVLPQECIPFVKRGVFPGVHPFVARRSIGSAYWAPDQSSTCVGTSLTA